MIVFASCPVWTDEVMTQADHMQGPLATEGLLVRPTYQPYLRPLDRFADKTGGNLVSSSHEESDLI